MSKQAEQYKDKGNDFFRKGDFAQAIENYTYATEIDPRNPIYFTNRSMCYYKMGEWAKSLRDAEKSVALDSKWPKGYYRAGMALAELGDLKGAWQQLQKAAELDSGSGYADAAKQAKERYYATMTKAEIIKTEGNEFFKAGEIDKAIEKYTAAIAAANSGSEEDQKTLADCYSNRAMCHQQRWEYPKVIEDCTACLEIQPTHVKALVRRAQAYEASERYKQALEDFERAVYLAPNTEVAFKGASRVRNLLRNSGQL